MPRIFRLSLVLLLLGSLCLSCASQPLGPPFERADFPPEHRSRIYIYRVDPRGSLATVDVKVDGLAVARFRDREYETLEVSAGPHRLAASMRGLAFVSLGWNEHSFRARPGETVYLEVSVRLTAQAAPPSRDLEIAGRSSDAASENVYLIERSAEEALSQLSTTTRVPH